MYNYYIFAKIEIYGFFCLNKDAKLQECEYEVNCEFGECFMELRDIALSSERVININHNDQ